MEKSELSKEAVQKLMRNETAQDARIGYRLRLAGALLALSRNEASLSLVSAKNSEEKTATITDLTQWNGWVQNLPKLSDYKAFHPVTAPKALLQAFGSLAVVPILMGDQEDFHYAWKEFLNRGGKATSDEWLWAELVIQTRIWEDGVGSLMVPLADAVNTGSEAECNIITEYGDYAKKKPFALVAGRDIPAGSELIDYYNDGDDDVYVRSWGFPLHLEKVKPSTDEQCQKLAIGVGGALDPKDGSCKAPEKLGASKGVFCTLVDLAKEHCGARLLRKEEAPHAPLPSSAAATKKAQKATTSFI